MLHKWKKARINLASSVYAFREIKDEKRKILSQYRGKMSVQSRLLCGCSENIFIERKGHRLPVPSAVVTFQERPHDNNVRKRVWHYSQRQWNVQIVKAGFHKEKHKHKSGIKIVKAATTEL